MELLTQTLNIGMNLLVAGAVGAIDGLIMWASKNRDNEDFEKSKLLKTAFFAIVAGAGAGFVGYLTSAEIGLMLSGMAGLGGASLQNVWKAFQEWKGTKPKKK